MITMTPALTREIGRDGLAIRVWLHREEEVVMCRSAI
jgi:hypothetical protein